MHCQHLDPAHARCPPEESDVNRNWYPGAASKLFSSKTHFPRRPQKESIQTRWETNSALPAARALIFEKFFLFHSALRLTARRSQKGKTGIASAVARKGSAMLSNRSPFKPTPPPHNSRSSPKSSPVRSGKRGPRPPDESPSWQ